MRPKIEIEKIRECYFNYSVSSGYGNAIYARHGLYSIEECLHDAATALGQNFPTTTIGYHGQELGEYSGADDGTRRQPGEPPVAGAADGIGA